MLNPTNKTLIHRGSEVFLFTLSNSKGTEVDITNYGAIVTAFRIKQADGEINDLVLGFDNPADYLSQAYEKNLPYFGAAIGRYANRIPYGKFTVGEKDYTVSTNDGEFHLHGGEKGFHKQVWEPMDDFETNKNVLELRHMSKDGEEGYPGNLEVRLKFTLTDNDELIHEYTATTDASTPVNFSHHSYFNLNKEKRVINDHLLQLNADHILEQDGYFITGNLFPVNETEFDFRTLRAIDRNWDPSKGFDHCYVLTRPGNKEMFLAAWAVSESSGIKLEIFTTEPAIQFYTGKWIPEIKGKNGITYKPFMGFCLESQKHTNALNIPGFPDTILNPGEEYYHKTMYRVHQLPSK
jgi:aldose 1-epimerase